jgi:SEC-C motif domain protein
MKHCVCGSGKQYKNCCQAVHQSHQTATKPEQLMRARYSAYVLGLVDFIIDTHHPSSNAAESRSDIEHSCQLNWIKLAVMESELMSQTEGFVHFKAFYNQAGKSYCLEERSRFTKEGDRWFYIDGQFPQ